MKWIKEIIVDIIVTVAIIVGVIINNDVLDVLIIGYTVLILLAKSLVIVGNSFLQLMQKTKTNAPDWISHLLYAINVAMLFIFGWWYTGSAWVLIWGLSYYTEQKMSRKAV